MTLKTLGNICLCQRIAMLLETLEIVGRLDANDAAQLYLAAEELKRRIPPLIETTPVPEKP